jgi:hypothetical protein
MEITKYMTWRYWGGDTKSVVDRKLLLTGINIAEILFGIMD